MKQFRYTCSVAYMSEYDLLANSFPSHKPKKVKEKRRKILQAVYDEIASINAYRNKYSKKTLYLKNTKNTKVKIAKQFYLVT